MSMTTSFWAPTTSLSCGVLRLVMIFGWKGTSAIFWGALALGVTYFAHCAMMSVTALYQSNVSVPGAIDKWGAFAKRFAMLITTLQLTQMVVGIIVTVASVAYHTKVSRLYHRHRAAPLRRAAPPRRAAPSPRR